MSSVNPTRQIANANASIDQGRQSLVTAEQKHAEVVLGGPGSAGAARHALFLAQQLISFGREQFQTWLQEAENEKKAMRDLRLGDNKDVAIA
jgi:hypothetical protein